MQPIRIKFNGMGSVSVSVKDGKLVIVPPKKIEKKFYEIYPEGIIGSAYYWADKKKMSEFILKVLLQFK